MRTISFKLTPDIFNENVNFRILRYSEAKQEDKVFNFNLGRHQLFERLKDIIANHQKLQYRIMRYLEIAQADLANHQPPRYITEEGFSEQLMRALYRLLKKNVQKNYPVSEDIEEEEAYQAVKALVRDLDKVDTYLHIV